MMLFGKRAREERPWGYFERFTSNEPSTVKILVVKPGQELSLQKHEKRSEFWRIIAGAGVVTLAAGQYPATVGDEFQIAPLMPHRLTAGPEGVTILEIAVGEFDENDETRLVDDYGRGSPPAA